MFSSSTYQEEQEKHQEEHKKQKDLLLEQFIKLEAHCFPPPKKEFVETVTYNKVLEIIEEFADGYVTINTLTNAGQSSASLTLDYCSRKAKGTKEEGSIQITLCTCGTNLSAVKIFTKFNLKKGEKISKKEVTRQTVFSEGCYGTLWQEFIKNKEK